MKSLASAIALGVIVAAAIAAVLWTFDFHGAVIERVALVAFYVMVLVKPLVGLYWH